MRINNLLELSSCCVLKSQKDFILEIMNVSVLARVLLFDLSFCLFKLWNTTLVIHFIESFLNSQFTLIQLSLPAQNADVGI